MPDSIPPVVDQRVSRFRTIWRSIGTARIVTAATVIGTLAGVLSAMVAVLDRNDASPAVPPSTTTSPAVPISTTMSPAAPISATPISAAPSLATSPTAISTDGPAKTQPDEPTATEQPEKPLAGRFVNAPETSTGCLAGLSFTATREAPPGTSIWVMAFNVAVPGEVYPERRLTFVHNRADVARFPIGSDQDQAGLKVEVIAIVLDTRIGDEYERMAATSGRLPVESAVPAGKVLDRFTVSRAGEYVPCR